LCSIKKKELEKFKTSTRKEVKEIVEKIRNFLMTDTEIHESIYFAY
jgi:hypothetical protein